MNPFSPLSIFVFKQIGDKGAMAFKEAILEKTPSVFVQLKGTCITVRHSTVLYCSTLWCNILMILYHIVL